MKSPVIDQTASLTFSDYFKLNAEVDEVLAHFGYGFEARTAVLPRTERELGRVEELRKRFHEALPHISLTSEAARREFLIAPIVMELIHYTRGRVRVEYAIDAGPQLHGTLDFFMQVERSLLVIEAKNADLTRGFTQLAVELVALDRWIENGHRMLHGAVSTGDIWQFGILDRSAKHVTLDLNLYRVPADLDPLLRILVGILAEDHPPTASSSGG